MIEFIEKYCRCGWCVFPVEIFADKDGRITKKPLITDWQNKSTNHLPTALELFKHHPNCQIGVATGKRSGITVIDIDVKNDKNGFDTLEKVIDIHSILKTPRQTTPTGGQHLFFQYTPDIRNSVSTLEGIDVRNDGGFIVIAPSKFPDGRIYEWLVMQEPWDCLYLVLPEELKSLLKPKAAAAPTLVKVPEKIKSGQRNDVLFKEACSLREKGYSQEEILASLRLLNKTRCETPLDDNELIQIASSSDKYPQGDLKKKSHTKESKCLLATLVDIINKDDSTREMLCFNEFSGEIEYRKAPPWNPMQPTLSSFSDEDFIKLKMYVSKKAKFEPSTGIFKEAVIYEASDHTYHPVRTHIKALEWDKKPRLDTWLINAAGAPDNSYIRVVGRKILVAAVARVFNPGCQFDVMMVLEGPQGIGKTTLVSILGHDWYSEIHIGENYKELVELMRGQWIIEVSEMICTTKTDVAHMRAFISRRKDRTRISYGARAENFPRQCIFIGTLNPSGDNMYLRDDTGNRRYWPVVCSKIDLEWLKIYRNQLFAEAYEIYKGGNEKLYLDDPKSADMAQIEQEIRQSEDPWMPLVVEFVRNPQNTEFTFIQLIQFLGVPKDRIDRLIQGRLGVMLRKLGVESRRVGKDRVTTYFTNLSQESQQPEQGTW